MCVCDWKRERDVRVRAQVDGLLWRCAHTHICVYVLCTHMTRSVCMCMCVNVRVYVRTRVCQWWLSLDAVSKLKCHTIQQDLDVVHVGSDLKWYNLPPLQTSSWMTLTALALTRQVVARAQSRRRRFVLQVHVGFHRWSPSRRRNLRKVLHSPARCCFPSMLALALAWNAARNGLCWCTVRESLQNQRHYYQ